MTQEEQMVEAARKALGTPFHHQGRVAGIGLDCIGLIIHALKAVDLAVADEKDYGRQPEPQRLIEALDGHGFRTVPAIEAGNVLLLRIKGQPQHVALVSSPTSMIHAYAPIGKVVETTIGETWRGRIAAIYRLES